MKISELILDYLKKNGRVVVSEFGVFTLENSNAELSSENDKILPPSKKIVFEENLYMKGDALINHIAKKKNITKNAAAFELQTQTDFWKKQLQLGDAFAMGDLGTFEKESNQLVFAGSKIVKDNPDFYGLEEISFSDIVNKATSSKEKKSKKGRFAQFILWFFLVIIPVGALVYLGITYQDYLTGEQTMKEITIKNSTHRIEDEPQKEQEIIITDRLVIDTLQTKTDSTNQWTPQP